MLFTIIPSSSGIAAAIGRFPWTPRLRLYDLGKAPDRDLPLNEMNDPVDTYASCMQDQLNR